MRCHDDSQADYVLCDRQGRPVAALEARRASIDPVAAQDQGRRYAEQLGAPFVFLSNGEEVRFPDRKTKVPAPMTAMRDIAGAVRRAPVEPVKPPRRAPGCGWSLWSRRGWRRDAGGACRGAAASASVRVEPVELPRRAPGCGWSL